MLDQKTLYIKKDGKEVAMDILFTVDNDKTNKKYVIFQDPNDESGEVYAYSYDDDGNLTGIETDEEWEMIEEVLGAFCEENL